MKNLIVIIDFIIVILCMLLLSFQFALCEKLFAVHQLKEMDGPISENNHFHHLGKGFLQGIRFLGEFRAEPAESHFFRRAAGHLFGFPYILECEIRFILHVFGIALFLFDGIAENGGDPFEILKPKLISSPVEEYAILTPDAFGIRIP